MTVLVEILHVLTISPTHKVCVRLSDTETKACIVGHVMVGATLLITSLKPDNGLDKSCWKNNIETFKHQSTNCSLAFMKPFRSLLQFNEYKYNARAKLFRTLTQPLHYINRCPVNHSNVQLRTFFFLLWQKAEEQACQEDENYLEATYSLNSVCFLNEKYEKTFQYNCQPVNNLWSDTHGKSIKKKREGKPELSQIHRKIHVMSFKTFWVSCMGKQQCLPMIL